MLNRFRFARVARALFRLHYDVQIEGLEHLHDGRVHLVMPNHPAFIDPLLFFAECRDVPLCPMVDERFFRNPFFAPVLRMLNAVRVPDLEKSRRREDVAQAQQLSSIALNGLRAGQDMIFYPSGHVALVPREVIGNRRLAYEVCRDLPDGTAIILVRTTGLQDSVWSKLQPKRWYWRRRVCITCEDMTATVREWAQTLDKRTFNARLEEWYNRNGNVLPEGGGMVGIS